MSYNKDVNLALSLHSHEQGLDGKNVYLCILEMWSEAIKMLKGEYTVRAIKEHKMDQAIIFCRTKIDCDNMEQYFIQQGGGRRHQCHVDST